MLLREVIDHAWSGTNGAIAAEERPGVRAVRADSIQSQVRRRPDLPDPARAYGILVAADFQGSPRLVVIVGLPNMPVRSCTSPVRVRIRDDTSAQHYPSLICLRAEVGPY
jgi:hypothetical protein